MIKFINLILEDNQVITPKEIIDINFKTDLPDSFKANFIAPWMVRVAMISKVLERSNFSLFRHVFRSKLYDIIKVY